ncbi:MAG: BF3164 family lipoprotein [Prolixibacteraceae bacterium]|nr:BF3164 family lipoprotein [Prolixibacteraceae bacterium]
MKKIVCKSFYRSVIFSLMSLFLFSCRPENIVLNENIVLFSKFSEEDKISFNNICEYKKGAVGMLELVDSVLIIFNVNEGAKYFLNNYSLNSDQIFKKYLSAGKGPGEVIGARGIGINNNFLWVQDITLKKILTLEKTNALSEDTLVSFNEHPVNEDYYMIDFKDKFHYFGVGFEHSAYKIQEVDLVSGKIINEIGTFDHKPDDLEFSAVKTAYQCFIHVKPTGDKIVLAYRFTDAIEIFDLKAQKNMLIHGPERFNADFQPAKNTMYRTDKTRFAFVGGGGTVTDNYIYMCYSGDLAKKSGATYAKYIYVYDWDGNPVRKLILDRQIEGLAVSEDDSVIYAFDVNTGFLIQAKIN